MDTRTTAHRPRAGGVGSQGWGGVVEPEGPLSRHGGISGQASRGRRLLHLLLMNERERLAKMRVGEGKGFRKRTAHVQRPKKRVLCLRTGSDCALSTHTYTLPPLGGVHEGKKQCSKEMRILDQGTSTSSHGLGCCEMVSMVALGFLPPRPHPKTQQGWLPGLSQLPISRVHSTPLP